MAEEELEEEKKKKLSREEKKALKEASNNLDDIEEEEKASNKVVVAFVTLLILIIWLGIIVILIKCDVGGFGSTVLYPMLKDVPYVNKVLPTVEVSLEEEDTQYQFDSIEEAVKRIKELEIQLETANTTTTSDQETIDSLNSQLVELQNYKAKEAEFEKIKEKFYEEVVFSDNAPDISQYKTFYESIEPDNAEVLYKQVVEQMRYKEDLTDYVKMYSSMKAKKAAAIFNDMEDDLDLVAAILKEMSPTASGEILGEMNTEIAAKVTEIMYPEKKK